MKEVVSFVAFIGMVTCLVAFVIVMGPLRVNVAQGAAEPADCWTRASDQLGCGFVTLVRADSSSIERGCSDALTPAVHHDCSPVKHSRFGERSTAAGDQSRHRYEA